jgi:hypothetical protein
MRANKFNSRALETLLAIVIAFICILEDFFAMTRFMICRKIKEKTLIDVQTLNAHI